MDKRELLRINIQFGKFLDPFIMLTIILIVLISILSVKSLTPQTFSQQENSNVLGIETQLEDRKFEFIPGEHNYITSETLTKVNPNNFKYTTLIKPREAGVISKPIIKIENINSLKVQLAYTNSTNSKISLVDKNMSVGHIIQKNNQSYSPNIILNHNSDSLYLLIENTKPIFFNQYLEINFFLNP